MYYMNKTKRNLILATAIINLIQITANLILSILLVTNKELFAQYIDYFYLIGFSTNLVYAIISFLIGLVGSIFLLYTIRQKGKFFRRTQGLFIAGFIIIILCGGFLPWILLFISCFIPDVIIMNTAEEIKQEQKAFDAEAKLKEQEYEEKKKKIEDLKRMRDNGLISEEEYKQKLFELL